MSVPLRSMTGFARVRSPLGDSELVVSAKSVNHRSLDLAIQVPSALDFVRKHGSAGTSAPIPGNPTWRPVVLPGKGPFTRTEDVDPQPAFPNPTPAPEPHHRRDPRPFGRPHGPPTRAKASPVTRMGTALFWPGRPPGPSLSSPGLPTGT